jgi:hypothetical protein
MDNSWIVCWQQNAKDYWEVFDDEHSANACYRLVMQDSQVAALTTVVNSSEHTHHTQQELFS